MLVWHHRLGYPSDIGLQVLKFDLKLCNSIKVDLCNVYHKANQTKESFSFSDHKSLENFQHDIVMFGVYIVLKIILVVDIF